MPPEDINNFDAWNEVKKKLDQSEEMVHFREREIRWCAVGRNIGSEVNGKGVRFSRPVLIIRRFGQGSFLGVPLTSQAHSGIWYSDVTVAGIKRCALLTQTRVFSSKRLYGKIDRISQEEYEIIRKKLSELFF